MKAHHVALVVAIALFGGLAGRGLAVSLPSATMAEARESAPRDDDQKWEYCAITRAQYSGSNRGGVYWISYFRNSGVQVVDVEAGPGGNALARAVFKLGEEGWEMVGEGPLDVRPGSPGGTPSALYFKRRKS